LRNRRELTEAAEKIHIGNLELCLANYSAEIRTDSELLKPDLTPTEFKLLYQLAKNEGRILSREQLLASLDDRVHVGDRTIDAHLSRIRKKLSGCTCDVEAIYGVGYRLRRLAHE
jgi:DNA-binding response OmpR family regulator